MAVWILMLLFQNGYGATIGVMPLPYPTHEACRAAAKAAMADTHTIVTAVCVEGVKP